MQLYTMRACSHLRTKCISCLTWSTPLARLSIDCNRLSLNLGHVYCICGQAVAWLQRRACLRGHSCQPVAVLRAAVHLAAALLAASRFAAVLFATFLLVAILWPCVLLACTLMTGVLLGPLALALRRFGCTTDIQVLVKNCLVSFQRRCNIEDGNSVNANMGRLPLSISLLHKLWCKA